MIRNIGGSGYRGDFYAKPSLFADFSQKNGVLRQKKRDMKIIYNNFLPSKGFAAINLFGVVFARKGKKLTTAQKNHEAIHTKQMQELGYIPFYLIYFLEWLFRLVFYTNTAYRGITFEQEAYEYQYDYDYLSVRKHFAQWRRSK